MIEMDDQKWALHFSYNKYNSFMSILFPTNLASYIIDIHTETYQINSLDHQNIITLVSFCTHHESSLKMTLSDFMSFIL